MQLVQHKQRRMFIYLKSLEMCQFRDALTLHPKPEILGLNFDHLTVNI